MAWKSSEASVAGSGYASDMKYHSDLTDKLHFAGLGDEAAVDRATARWSIATLDLALAFNLNIDWNPY